MSTRSPVATIHRDGRLVVGRFGSDEIRAVNVALGNALDLARNSNARAASPSEGTELVGVWDKETQTFHLLHVHRVNFRSQRPRPAGNVVVFSESDYAPSVAERI